MENSSNSYMEMVIFLWLNLNDGYCHLIRFIVSQLGLFVEIKSLYACDVGL